MSVLIKSMDFHHHLPHILHHHHGKHSSKHHHHDGSSNVIPKGFVAITVGQGEDQQKFVIPVMYVNHPLFMHLLKEAEEEYGFDQKGPINIPCHVDQFCHIRGIIDKETTSSHHHHHHHQQQHHHHHHFLCFKA